MLFCSLLQRRSPWLGLLLLLSLSSAAAPGPRKAPLGKVPGADVSFLPQLEARGMKFIGQPYSPKWHGTIPELKANLTYLAQRYPQDIVVVEYSERKREVNGIAFNLPGGKGSFIPEPLNTWESIFEKQGQANDLLLIYDEISRKFRVK